MKKRVLCLLADGFEELELVAPVDVLRRSGADVVLAVVGEDLQATGRNGLVLRGDARLEDVGGENFDLLLIPGGPAVGRLREDGRAAKLAGDFVSAGKLVAAICAGPLVLADAGLLKGRRFTAHFSTSGELEEALSHERVVEDGPLITARGAGAALEFGFAVVNRLFGAGKREEIARDIMA